MGQDYERVMSLFVFERVESKSKDKKKLAKVRSLSSRMPTLIRFNGLAPTFAFLMDKNNDEHKFVMDCARDWLMGKSVFSIDGLSSKTTDLYKSFCKLDSHTYRLVTNDLIKLYTWMKRFTNAFREKNGGSND